MSFYLGIPKFMSSKVIWCQVSEDRGPGTDDPFSARQAEGRKSPDVGFGIPDLSDFHHATRNAQPGTVTGDQPPDH